MTFWCSAPGAASLGGRAVVVCRGRGAYPCWTRKRWWYRTHQAPLSSFHQPTENRPPNFLTSTIFSSYSLSAFPSVIFQLSWSEWSGFGCRFAILPWCRALSGQSSNLSYRGQHVSRSFLTSYYWHRILTGWFALSDAYSYPIGKRGRKCPVWRCWRRFFPVVFCLSSQRENISAPLHAPQNSFSRC